MTDENDKNENVVDEKGNIIADEWNDVAMKQMRSRFGWSNKLMVAFCLISVDPDDKSLNVTADILGDKSGPMPESDRTAILQVFERFEADIKKIFGAEDYNPAEAWKNVLH